MIPIIICAVGTIPKGVETGSLGNRMMSPDYSNYSIAKIGQNTENRPGALEATCCHSNSSVKKLQGIIIIDNILANNKSKNKVKDATYSNV